MSNGYDFSRGQLLEAFTRMQFPERTQRESAIIRDFLLHHVEEFDSYSFSVRVGTGTSADPSHLPGVQATTVFSSKKRIDILAWKANQPFIFEVKLRANPGALGQLLAYRHLWMQENPDALEPRLAVIARTIDDDTARVLRDHGIPVYLYDEGTGDSGAPGGRVPPPDGASA